MTKGPFCPWAQVASGRAREYARLPMTPDDVRDRLAAIAQCAQDGDDESAHQLQDTLWLDVLKAIALDDAVDPQKCARLAASADELEFSRWCA